MFLCASPPELPSGRDGADREAERSRLLREVASVKRPRGDTAVAAAGLSEGGCGFDFVGDYSTPGCYTYASGQYEGCGYWSTSGDPTAPVTGSSGGGIRVRVCAAP